MKRILVFLMAWVMLVAACGCADAENDLLEELLAAAEQTETPEAGRIQEALAAFGVQAGAEEVHDAPYDAILGACEQAYGSYYSWPPSRRYRFDLLMVRLGELAHCVNLDPSEDALGQSEALERALGEIAQRYGDAYRALDFAASVSYCASAADSAQGMWRFGIEFSNGDAFSSHVLHGEVIHCADEKKTSSLELEYNDLCEKKGAFFKWSLQEKTEFANSLPDKLLLAQAKNERCPSYDELAAISRYGFCMPTEHALPEEEARRLALEAVQAKYGLPEDWAAQAEIYDSFFLAKTGKYVWRIILWNTGSDAFSGGVVEMDSETGEILKVEKNGGTAQEAIPYLDRV